MTIGQHSPSDSGQDPGPQNRQDAGQQAFLLKFSFPRLQSGSGGPEEMKGNGTLDCDGGAGEAELDGSISREGDELGVTGIHGGPWSAQEIPESLIKAGQHSPPEFGHEAGPQKRQEEGQQAFRLKFNFPREQSGSGGEAGSFETDGVDVDDGIGDELKDGAEDDDGTEDCDKLGTGEDELDGKTGTQGGPRTEHNTPLCLIRNGQHSGLDSLQEVEPQF